MTPDEIRNAAADLDRRVQASGRCTTDEDAMEGAADLLRELADDRARLATREEQLKRAENILAGLRVRLRDSWPVITLLLDAYEAKYGETRHG